MNRNLWLLALCQGLFISNNATFIAINGLVGWSLAPYGWMATLPIMGYVVGAALFTGPVARVQAALGRKRSFQTGLLMAMASTLVCAYGAATRNFWLICLGTVLAGYYSANANLYRFAAIEISAPTFKEKAVSLVLAGGLMGAVIGPWIASHTRDMLPTLYVGTYVALTLVALVALLLISPIEFPDPPAQQSARDGGRPMSQILRQPVFIVAGVAGALSYGVMNLMMAATPIAMQQCGLPFSDAASVLQWHLVGMFAPGFFTGHLIRRYGALQIMVLGTVLTAVCVGIALAGVEFGHFLWSMFLDGVGWNFIFTAATTMSASTYAPQERDRAQGALNLMIFGTQAVTALSSGVLITTQGWTVLNIGSMVPVIITAFGVAWLWKVTARPSPA